MVCRKECSQPLLNDVSAGATQACKENQIMRHKFQEKLTIRKIGSKQG